MLTLALALGWMVISVDVHAGVDALCQSHFFMGHPICGLRRGWSVQERDGCTALPVSYIWCCADIFAVNRVLGAARGAATDSRLSIRPEPPTHTGVR
jgi:hypothetical protein